MVQYVLGVRCVAYAKGLRETYMTSDRRLLQHAAAVYTAAVLLLRLINTKTGQAGNFEIVDIFNAENIQLIQIFVVKSEHSWSYHTGFLAQVK